MESLLIAAAVFVAVFVQTVSGFGIALIAMPLLAPLVGVAAAAPLVALVAMACRIGMLAYYRTSFSFRLVWRLMLASALGIPVGLILVDQLDRHTVEIGLGVVVIGYALYALWRPRLLTFERRRWAYGLGFLSGVLAGAYNAGGPPAVIYATGREWPPDTFKSNLQGLAILTGGLVIAGHLAKGSYTPDVLRDFAITVPALAAALLAGFRMDRRIHQAGFRKLVLALLLVLGAQLIV